MWIDIPVIADPNTHEAKVPIELPAGAAIVGLRVTGTGPELEARFANALRARGAYHHTVWTERDDPYLLEWTSDDHYRLHVFPATDTTRISIDVELAPAPEQVRVDRSSSLYAGHGDAYARHEVLWPGMRPHVRYLPAR